MKVITGGVFIRMGNYPFGMPEPGRGYQAGSVYRYGFNGKEKEPDVSSGDYDFGARVYDSRIGVWLSVDRAIKEYVAYSPYNFCAGNPIINVDLDGERVYFIPGLAYNPAKPEKYIPGIEQSFRDNDIDFMTVNGSAPNLNATGKLKGLKKRLPDLKFVIDNGWRPMKDPMQDVRVKNTVETIARDLVNNKPQGDEQVNLLGTSQGAVTVAQAAIELLENSEKYGLGKDFKIDNLVLAGAPIAKRSPLYKKLKQLQSEKRIGEIHYKDFQSKNGLGINNDEVTGIARGWKVGTIFRGVIAFLDVLFFRRDNHPHLKAAENRATEKGYSSFGDQIVSKLKAKNIR